MNLAGVTKSTWIRTIILIIALVNQVLSVMGLDMLPIQDEQVETLVTVIFTVMAAIASWWKNNSFTLKAQTADEVLKGE